MSRKTLLVFDIDGTLTESVKQHHLAFRQSLQAIGVRNIGPTFQEYPHITDSYIARAIYEEDLQKPFSKEIHQQFEKELTNRIRQIGFQEIAGAQRIINSLKTSPEIGICFATGSFRRPAMHKLESAGIYYHEDLLTGSDELEEREQIVAQAIEQATCHYKVSSFEKVIALGDGKWDFLTARNLGIEFIGIGKEHAETLTVLGATRILEDFTNFAL